MTPEQQHPQTTADIAYGAETQQPPTDDGTRDGSTDGMREAQDRDTAPLLPEERSRELNEQWSAIQSRFVDTPREAVEQADGLVAEVIQDLARTFADERSSLEQQWDRDEDVDTEALRLALQRYRSFFHRLLAA